MRWVAARLFWSVVLVAAVLTVVFAHAYMGWSGPTILLVAVAAILVAIFVRLGRRFG